MSLALDNQIGITQDIQDMEEECGYPNFAWNGASYGCVPSNFKRMAKLKQGGFDVDIPTTMTVRKFAVVDCMLIPLFNGIEPQLNDLVVLNGDSFWIKTTTTDITGTFYQIELKRNKN